MFFSIIALLAVSSHLFEDRDVSNHVQLESSFKKMPPTGSKKGSLFFSALFSSHCTPGQSVILYSLPFPPRPLYLVGSRTASTARLLPSDPHLAGSDGDITRITTP